MFIVSHQKPFNILCRPDPFELRSRADIVDLDHPTYYHFHIHVVNVMLEAGSTQAVGKAFELENLISQLELMGGGPSNGLAEATLTYSLGEESELWREIFKPLKQGKTIP